MFLFPLCRFALVTAVTDKTDTMGSLEGTGGTGKMAKMAQRSSIMLKSGNDVEKKVMKILLQKFFDKAYFIGRISVASNAIQAFSLLKPLNLLV